MEKKTIKKICEILIYVLTCVAGFVGGQASAHNNVIDLFNKNQIERIK